MTRLKGQHLKRTNINPVNKKRKLEMGSSYKETYHFENGRLIRGFLILGLGLPTSFCWRFAGGKMPMSTSCAPLATTRRFVSGLGSQVPNPLLFQLSSILFGGYYGTQYRVRLYPPPGV